MDVLVNIAPNVPVRKIMKKITQIKSIILSVLLISSSILSATVNKTAIKNNFKTKTETASIKKYKLNVSPKAQSKVGGLLLKNTISKQFAIDAMKKGKVLQQKPFGKLDREIIAVYLTRKPTKLFDEKLEALGINRKNQSWIPAVGNHKYGFAIYIAPIDKIETLAEMPEIMRIQSLEQTYNGQLREANGEKGINARYVWNRFEYFGQGLTIGIIDTGYDVGNPDLPDPIAKWKYYYDEEIIVTSNVVTNIVLEVEKNADVTDNNSGHGTYIAGCIVGNGTLANENKYDYMTGIAPSAQVHIVKADLNYLGIQFFNEAVLIQALDDLSESNSVDIINMSLGGWDAYHDGSSPLNQAVDYVTIEKGIPVFCAAGNLANKKQHVFAEIDPLEGKEIKFTVITTNRQIHSVAFNLIWADGYDENKHELFYDRWDILPQNPRINPAHWPLLTFSEGEQGERVESDNHYHWYYDGYKYDSTISPRGKVRQQWYGLNERMGWEEDPDKKVLRPKTVRLLLTNKVNLVRYFHLYIDLNPGGPVTNLPVPVAFEGASSKYTVTSPGTSDRAFTIGSFVSRTSFSNRAASNDTTVATAGITLVSAFSGRGPRVDQTNLREKDEFSYEEVRYEHVKPDFLCPGELVISVLNRKTRDDYECPPFYAIDNVASQAWQRSLPAWEEFYFEEEENEYTNLNYYCPLAIFGDFWFFKTSSYYNVTSFTNESFQLGTSPASAFGSGSAALMFQAFPCLQIEELRRYMRPGYTGYPHYPGTYSVINGFGRLYLEDIFKDYDAYVDTTTFLNYLSLVPNSETNIVIENSDTIWVTNNSISLAGNYQSVYCAKSFYLTNFLTGWSKEVDYVNLTNRAWWADNVVLSNYVKQKIGICLDLGIPNGSTEYLDEYIHVWQRHGLNRPLITIIDPTTAPSIKYEESNLVDEISLGGVWSDDSDIKTTKAIESITWRNNTTGERGTVSNISIIGAGGTGTWYAGTIPIEKPSYNKFSVTIVDDDGDSFSKTLVVDNGSKLFNIEKLNFKVNLAKPEKDLLKIQGFVKNVTKDALFEVGNEFYIGLVQTNGVVTNLLSFVTTADNIKAKGRKAIYLDKVKKGHVFKVTALRKKKDDDIKIKIIMKKFDGLEEILEIDPVDAKKKDSPHGKEMMFKGKVCGFVFQSGLTRIPYWGKLDKNIIGKK